ncbi:MAG: hypothetical protein R2851_05630 [Caldilineaceae bacterium]
MPDILFQLVAGGALLGSVHPHVRGLLGQGRPGRRGCSSHVLNLVTLLLVLFAGLAAFFAEPIVARVIAPGFAPAQQALTADLMRAGCC